MDLDLKWLAPFGLIDGTRNGLIYDLEDLNEVPESPGVYVFARIHGQTVSPLYIGKAENIFRRIEQQLNNVRLMRGLEDAEAGSRTLHVAEFIAKKGQDSRKAINIIESALISAALVEGYELINIKGTKTPVHTITSTGNREARRWLPENTIKLRRS